MGQCVGGKAADPWSHFWECSSLSRCQHGKNREGSLADLVYVSSHLLLQVWLRQDDRTSILERNERIKREEDCVPSLYTHPSD